MQSLAGGRDHGKLWKVDTFHLPRVGPAGQLDFNSTSYKKDIILILCLRPSLKSNSLRHRQVDGLRHVLSIFGGKQHLAEPGTPHTIQVFDSLSSGGSVSIIQ